MKSTFRLLPAESSDVPTLVDIYFSAFQNTLSLAAFPRTAPVRKWWEDMLYSEIEDPEASFLNIVEAEEAEPEHESMDANDEANAGG